MAGVVFIITIPTEDHEKILLNKVKNKVTIEENPEIIPILDNDSIKVNCDVLGSNLGKKKECRSMQKILQTILKQLEITNSTWNKTDGNQFLQIIFPVECGDKCEEILEILKETKIGKRFNSIVSVIPCTIHYHGSEYKGDNSRNFEEEDFDDEGIDKITAWGLFVSSVKSRLTVAQVVENVKAHAALTFDFIFLLLISTTLCAIGMVENSNVYLLSSMLISPMMGPVMAGTFGSVIQDKRLQKVGVQNELIGLGIATIVGFCYGSVICLITDKYGTQDWPTYEMSSRGELRSLWVGCLIALLSGAAVALGILSDNIASLVGVAISTSLMPPAVNAGLLWSLASVYYIKGNETTRYASITHTDHYSQNSYLELLTLGAVSICLTFVNIVCIYLAGILVFKIKEVAPMTSKDQAKRRFWKHDIKIARDYNKTLHQGEANNMFRTLSEEIENYHATKDILHHSTDLSKENLKISVRRPQYTWSPCSNITSKLSDANEKFKSSLSKNLHFNLNQKNNYQHRRLSQIFAPSVDEKLKTIDENNTDKRHFGVSPRANEPSTSSAKHFFSGNKKFVVTPCESDPLMK